jgi:DNA end-binding protein Ku
MSMARPLWKGAISFGLVTIPVNVFSATRRDELRFRQLDRRDNTPIREKRVNEETGEEVAWDDIVKGYEYDEGSFVVLDQDDFSKANIKATETIDIVQAVPHDAVPPQYFEKPLYVVPGKGGTKAYHILRETLLRTGRVAIAMIVMRGRQHLAELVAALDEPWAPEQFRDEYRDDLLELIAAKAKTGLAPVKRGAPARQGGEVVDMMELLKKSVGEAKGRKGQRRRKAS